MGSQPRHLGTLALLTTVNFMVILDAQIVLLALPPIEEALQMSTESGQWVLSAYLLGFGGLLLLGGRIGDLLGRRRVFVAGTAVFGLASLGCGLATSATVLIVARAAQGVGAALMAPNALGLLLTTFPRERERARALAVWGGVGGLGATAALLIGGILTGWLGWRWVFLFNVPVAVVLLASSRRLPADPRGAGRTAPPLVPTGLFRSPPLLAGNALTLLVGVTAWGAGLLTSIYAQQVLGYGPLAYGLGTAALTVMAMVGAFGAQALLATAGIRLVAVAATGLLGVGTVLLAGISVDGNYVSDLLPGLMLFGTGLGAAAVAGSVAALDRVPETDAGVASGLNTAAFQLGGALGAAFAVTVIAANTSVPGQVGPVTAGLRAGFLATAAIAGLAVLIALALPGRRREIGTGAAVELEADRPARTSEPGPDGSG